MHYVGVSHKPKATTLHNPTMKPSDHLSRNDKLSPARKMAALTVAFFLGLVFGFFYSHFKPTTPRLPPNHDLVRFRTTCATPLLSSQVIPEVTKRIYNDVSPYTGFPPAHVWDLLSKRGPVGWGSTSPVFEEMIRMVWPRTIIEVGSFLGASALHMANLTKQLGLDNTAILCLDDFRAWAGFRSGEFSFIGETNGDIMLMYEFMWNIMEAGEQDRILALPFSTSVGLEALCDMGIYGDLVVVDAGHDFHSAWDDINRAWMVVRPGGMVFGHDYENNVDDFGVRRAVDLFAELKGLTVKQNGEHWILYPVKGL